MSDIVSKTVKRGRATNWSDAEKRLVVMAIEPFKAILENKAKLASSNREKEKCWIEIQKQFLVEGYNNRPIARLKEQWKRMKVVARKDVSSDQKEKCATGGGPYTPAATDLDEMVVDIVPHVIIEDVSLFDCDNEDTQTVTKDGNILQTSDMTQESEFVEIIPPLIVPENITVENASEKEPEVAKEASQKRTRPLKESKRRQMTEYEQLMLKLNKQKIDQPMRYAGEEHKLNINYKRKEHLQRMKYERILFNLRRKKLRKYH